MALAAMDTDHVQASTDPEPVEDDDVFPTSNIHMLHVGGSARRCHTLSVRTKSQDEDAYFDRDSLRNVGIAENASNV